MASTTSDQISVRARQLDGAIHYRIVGEYEEEESMRYELPFEHMEQPLTLAELIGFIDGACHPEPAYPGGIFTSNWEALSDMGYEACEIIEFLSLSSPFYPQLEACYQVLGERWLQDNQELEDEDE